jgi:aminopeptidase N
MLRRLKISSILLAFALVDPCHAGDAPYEPKRSEKFSGPARDAPSRDFDAIHLRLECSFDWDSRTVTASATHDLRALRSGVRAVELDAVGLEVKSVALGDGRPLGFETFPGKLRIDLGKEARAGEDVRIAIAYRARPARGVYFQRPGKDSPDTPKQVWTQGESEEARHWIPCFDHPSDKLTTEVLVAAPAPMVAISNGKLLSSEPRGDGRVFHFLQDRPHTTYLITVVVGEFAVWKGDAGGIPLAAYVPLDRAADAARSFELTADMMEFFNSRTGYRYPWAKYDQVCASGFPFGGMENTSATTLTENTLHDERAALDVSSMGLVAHELAHQWFGDLVTCKDWGDIWLNESFATFFANLYTEHRLGWDEGLYERFEDARQYKREDRGRYRRPLSTRSWKSPEDLFDAHSYPKGGLILNMLRHVLGEEGFRAGIKLYLERNAFRSVETADFRIAMEDATGMSLGWFFDQWVHRGGHPHFRVAWSWDASARAVQIDVEQIQKTDDLTPLFRVPVGLAITTPSGRAEHRAWVSERKHSFTYPAAERPRLVRFDPGDWVLEDIEFEKSKEELLYQLEHDPDMLGRREAAEALAKHAGDDAVTAALLRRLEIEPFWGVRLEIADVLGGTRREALLEPLAARLRSEPKSRVRAEIVRALGDIRGAKAVAALREAVAGDPSYRVVSQALRALGRAAGKDAHPDAIAALSRASHLEVIRAAAIDALIADESVSGEARAEVVRRLLSLAAAGQPREVRGAAIGALGRFAKGDEQVFAALSAALEDDRLRIRLAAVEALAAMGDRRAIPLLEARLGKEERVVLRDPTEAIRAAIARIEGQTDMKALQEEVRRLLDSNRRLEERIRGLETRAPRGPAPAGPRRERF